MEHDPLRCHPALLTLAFHSDGHSDSPGLRLIKAAAGTVLQSERCVFYSHAWNGPLKIACPLVVLPILALGLSSLGACASMPGLSGVELNRDQASQGGKTFGEGVGQAATAPLDDLNLRRQEVPEVLITARRAPYATAGLQRCSAVVAQIDALDEALGPDVDQPTPATGTGDQAANAALDMVRDTATDFIPLRSWVRRLSGAAAHDREVQAAIRAGLVRRGFLKGIAHQRRCTRTAG